MDGQINNSYKEYTDKNISENDENNQMNELQNELDYVA